MNESSQYWSVLLDQNPLQLDRKGIKKGKMVREVAVVVGGGGTITQRRQLFQIFPFKRGDHFDSDESKNGYYLRIYSSKCFCSNNICLIKHAIHMYIHKKYCL